MADIKYIDLKDNDCVEFYLYPDLSVISLEENVTFQFLEELMLNINNTVKRLSKNYIWHNEEFQISPRYLNSYLHSVASEPLSFYGSLNYGENIDDEWFLVYLLVELTKEIDGLVVQVKDGDGEFLLIEAAEQLPAWITPQTGEERTFLYKGEIHVLPKTYKPSTEQYFVTEKVLKYVRENSQLIKCDQCVQKAIEYKISGFQNKIDEKYHNATIYLPVGVAALIDIDNKLIAPAIRAFCDRDLLDIKACRAMKYFPPENRVYTHVRFTKLLYVMLATSKYIPDRRTGWNLPQPNDKNYKSHLLGIKLACGFEILLSRVTGENNKEDSIDLDFTNDSNWKKFLTSLSARNYFRGLLEHSKKYNELLDNAKEYYKNCCKKSLKPNMGKNVLDLFNKIDIDADALRKRQESLPQSDDDSWMDITKEELDSLLEARFGKNIPKADDLSSHIDSFINHMSGIEGAEFPKKKGNINSSMTKRGTPKKRKAVKFSPDTKIADSGPNEVASNSNSITFEAEGFLNAIQSILDISIPDDDYWESEGSGMSSYEDESDTELERMAKSSKKESDFIRYMDQMDQELSGSTLGKSFVTKAPPEGKQVEEFDGAERFKPVDVDLNALKNMISSYRAQMGEPGPAENLLGPLGVRLDDVESDVN